MVAYEPWLDKLPRKDILNNGDVWALEKVPKDPRYAQII